MNLPICLSTVLVMRFPILAWISGSLRSGSALTDRFKFEFFRRGSADIDRLKLGLVCPGLRLGPLVPTVRPGDLRLVDILTLVWPPTGIVVWVVGLVVRRFGDGEGLDRRVVGLEEADLAFDAPSLKFSMKGWQGTTYFVALKFNQYYLCNKEPFQFYLKKTQFLQKCIQNLKQYYTNATEAVYFTNSFLRSRSIREGGLFNQTR